MGVRPPLPYRAANPNIKDHLTAQHLPPVKFQLLNCQGKDILVGRLKIDTPTDAGHAFILRRYDTGAVSLTTMFRAAFPSASEYEERSEVQWVRENFDLTGTNGSTKDATITRLAGTWVHPPLAMELGKTYALGPLIEAMVTAEPDPAGNYRRSAKNANNNSSSNVNNGPAASPLQSRTPAKMSATTATVVTQNTTVVVSKPPSKTLPTPSPTSGNPPAKRRKEASPVPTPAQSQSSMKPPSTTRISPMKPPSTISTSTLTAGTVSSAATRRSTRKSKSPAPRTLTAKTTVRTPKRANKKDDLAPLDEEGPAFEEGPGGTDLMEEDLKEQKRLIEDLKSQQAEAEAAKASQGDPADMDVEEEGSSQGKKREREEEAELKFNFQEPSQEAEDRQIATNRRVGRFQLEPRTKSFAWGVAAFAVGMSAVTFLPDLFL